MPYCTKQDLIDRFGEVELLQLTDRDNLGAIDDTVLGQALADAAAEIDGWLAGRYSLPLAVTPPALVRVGCDLARYQLYASHPTDNVKERYDHAVRFLRAAASGEIKLLGQSGAPAESAGVAEFTGGRKVFNGGGF